MSCLRPCADRSSLKVEIKEYLPKTSRHACTMVLRCEPHNAAEHDQKCAMVFQINLSCLQQSLNSEKQYISTSNALRSQTYYSSRVGTRTTRSNSDPVPRHSSRLNTKIQATNQPLPCPATYMSVLLTHHEKTDLSISPTSERCTIDTQNRNRYHHAIPKSAATCLKPLRPQPKLVLPQ